MNSLMPELISLIYDFLPWIRDQVKFSLVCKYVHAAMSTDIRRILDIRHKYAPILNEINAIKYTQYHDCMSVLQYNNTTVAYESSCSIKWECEDETRPIYCSRINIINFTKNQWIALRNLWFGQKNISYLSTNKVYPSRVNSMDKFIEYRKSQHDWHVSYKTSDICENLRVL